MSPVTPLPHLTEEQRQQGLHKALERRRERAELLAQLKTDQVDLATVLGRLNDDQADDDERALIGRTQLRTVLLAVRGIGAARADRILTDLGLPPDRRLSTLSRLQRDKINRAVTEAVSSWH